MSPAFTNAIGVAAGLCGAVAFAPQIFKLLRSHEAAAISLKMFSVMVAGFSLWLVYGIAEGKWPIILANGVMLAMAATILLLKLKYR